MMRFILCFFIFVSAGIAENPVKKVSMAQRAKCKIAMGFKQKRCLSTSPAIIHKIMTTCGAALPRTCTKPWELKEQQNRARGNDPQQSGPDKKADFYGHGQYKADQDRARRHAPEQGGKHVPLSRIWSDPEKKQQSIPNGPDEPHEGYMS